MRFAASGPQVPSILVSSGLVVHLPKANTLFFKDLGDVSQEGRLAWSPGSLGDPVYG